MKRKTSKNRHATKKTGKSAAQLDREIAEVLSQKRKLPAAWTKALKHELFYLSEDQQAVVDGTAPVQVVTEPSFAPTTRPIVSEPPPAGNGTIRRTGRDG